MIFINLIDGFANIKALHEVKALIKYFKKSLFFIIWDFKMDASIYLILFKAYVLSKKLDQAHSLFREMLDLTYNCQVLP